MDLGLRAPRKAFPSDYLEFVDKSAMRRGQEVGSPSVATQEILQHWHRIGEDRFTSLRGRPVIAEQTYFVET